MNHRAGASLVGYGGGQVSAPQVKYYYSFVKSSLGAIALGRELDCLRPLGVKQQQVSAARRFRWLGASGRPPAPSPVANGAPARTRDAH